MFSKVCVPCVCVCAHMCMCVYVGRRERTVGKGLPKELTVDLKPE